MSVIRVEQDAMVSAEDAYQPANANKVLLSIVIICCAMIIAFLFTLPFRETPTSAKGLDFVAQGKFASRAGSLVVLALVNLILIRRRTINEIVPIFFGFALFALWSAASVTWSPLESVSAGQVVSMVVMLVLAFAIAQLTQTESDVRIILISLNLLIIGRAVMLLAVYFAVGPEAISRELGSYFHSTAAAETAAPGIVLLISTAACYRDRWTKLMVVPGLLVLGVLFVIAQNRLSLLIAPGVILLVLITTGNRLLILKLVFVLCLVIPFYMLMDPGLELVSSFVGSTEEYATRSEDSGEAISTLSGRTEMWAAVWEEYLKSPIRGHGFFVTSSTGELDVWYEIRNYTAHNQLLQVLSSTGIVGLIIFLFAMSFPFMMMVRSLFIPGPRRRLAMVAGFVSVWFFFWSLLNSSFSGALGGSSVIFYILLGLVVGGLCRSGIPIESKPNASNDPSGASVTRPV